MDHLTIPTASMVTQNTIVQAEQGFSLKHLIPLLAVFAWIVEYKRRAPGVGTEIIVGKRVIRQLIPEVVCLTIMSVVLGVSLLYRRERYDAKDPAFWNNVKLEWPIFITADTLIGLQALLRVVFLLSASLRRNAFQLSPLDGEPAAFLLLAAVARVSLLGLSPRDIYHLDGPLGGDMNVAVEITGLLLLLPLGYGVFKKGISSVAAVLLTTVVLGLVALRNHFALADLKDANQRHLDMIWVMAFTLEIAAAFAFHIRSSWLQGRYSWDAFTGFAHFMLPVMQALPTYFICVAFAPPFKVEPALVGEGRPFEVCQYGGLIQLLVYLVTAIVYTVSCADEKHMSTLATVVPEQLGEAPPVNDCILCMYRDNAMGSANYQFTSVGAENVPLLDNNAV